MDAAARICPACRAAPSRVELGPAGRRCEGHGRLLVTEEAFAAGDGDALLGVTLDDRFVLAARLGAGSSGVVYRAVDTTQLDPVAVKIQRGIGPDAALRRRRFESALVALERLGGHPGARFLARGSFLDPARDEAPFEGALSSYVAMELVVGESLAARLASGGALPPAEGVELVVRLLEALGAAHARGVVHGDLRLEHVIVGPSGALTLLDFGGIAGQCEAVVGTALTMAPEMVRGEPPSFASDVYAVGVLLFQLVSGQPPFRARDALAVRRAHGSAPVPPLVAARGGELPPALQRVAQRALAKEPRDRPDGAFAFAAELTESFRTYPVRVRG